MKAMTTYVLMIGMVIALFVSGLLGGTIYYTMQITQATFETVNFDIPGANASAGNVTTFQDILEIVAYPMLEMRESIPYITYFFVFGIILAFLISGFLTVKHPAFLMIHILVTIIAAWFCLSISNAYETILLNPFMREMMSNQPIYNKIMLNLPSFVGFTGLITGAIGFLGTIRRKDTTAVDMGGY